MFYLCWMSAAEITTIIVEVLRAKGCSESITIDLTLLGPPMIAQGFTQDQILRALEAMFRDGRLAHVPSNGVRFTGKPSQS